jgi:hypothetical protein
VGSLLDTVRDLTGQNWIDPNEKKVTLDNPAYAAYLTSIVEYYRDLGADNVSKFRQDVPPLTDTRDGGENRGRQVAIVSGYWTVSDVATMSQNPTWTFSASWAPAMPSVGKIQRVGGRLIVIPIGSRQPAGGWDLTQFLVGDLANTAFFSRTGRFVATQSFLAAKSGTGPASLQFFIDSMRTATQVKSHDGSPVASFAEVKWEQAVSDVLAGNRSVADALGIAQKTVDAEYRLVEA